MASPAEIAATLLAYGRGKQHRSPGFHARADECLADRDERRETACVVGDARALEPRPAPGDGNIELGSKHRIEVCGEHDRSYRTSLVSIPRAHIPDLVNLHIRQPCLA